MRKCVRCGKRADDSARFCPNCGEGLPQIKEENGGEKEIDEATLHIDTEVREGPPRTAIVTMDGTVEAKDARLLRSIFHELDEKKVKRIILDLKDVVYMSSAALGLLVSYATDKKQAEDTHCVYLVAVSQAVGGAMSVLGLIPFFAIFPNMKSALDTLGL
jgi:anti-anti-sigma factor